MNKKFEEKIKEYKEREEKALKLFEEFNKASEGIQEMYSSNIPITPNAGYGEGPYGSGGIHYVYTKKKVEDEARECGMELDDFLFQCKENRIWFDYSDDRSDEGWQNSSSSGC